jgi:uncharacterized protein
MPHQCVKCSKIIPQATKEIIEGCESCGGKFFFYIREEQLEKIKEKPQVDIPEPEKIAIEKDVREIAGITDEEAPVILDLESIRFLGDGKYEIDVVNLFNKERPLIYKFDEGKYMIDLASTLKQGVKDFEKDETD